jgi:Domain of unknown function (DUF1905)
VAFFTHGFEGVIQRFGVGRDRKVWYAVLFLPDAVAADLPFDRHPRLRVRGEIADFSVAGAWMPTGDGRRYFIVSPAVRRGAEVDVGSTVEMRSSSTSRTASTCTTPCGGRWSATKPSPMHGMA